MSAYDRTLDRGKDRIGKDRCIDRTLYRFSRDQFGMIGWMPQDL